MKAQINRKAFLQASLATTLVGLVGCAGEGAEGGGDGDGDMGTGGSDPGSSGGAGTGGDTTNTGGAGTGGDTANTGGAGTGGDAATGGAGTGGDGGGLMCTQDIVVESSGDPDGHTHSLTVTAAMLEAGVAVTGLETGPAPEAGNHTHNVDLSAEDIATLKAGGVVTKFTCDGNDHEFVISCDPGAPAPTPTVDGLLAGFCD